MWTPVGLQLWETRQKVELTREGSGYTSKSIRMSFFLGLAARSGSRARRRSRNSVTSAGLMSRFRRISELGLPKPAPRTGRRTQVSSRMSGPKVPIGERMWIGFRIWVYLRGHHSSNAGTIGAMGWPPNRQHEGQGDSCSACGQNCNLSSAFGQP